MQTLTRPVSPEIMRKDDWVPEDLAAKLRSFNPRSEMGRYVRECLHFLPVQMAAELIDRVSRTLVLESSLSIMTRVWDDLQGAYVWRDHGLVCQKVVTTAGVNFLVDAWQNSVELEIMKYHGLGTGSTAEGSGDTALVTELTTEYTGDVRATGSLTEGATANVFRTVGTNTLDGTPGAALREHGIFSASTVGTLWDRSVFASITLSSGESLQSQYDLTASAGG